MKTLLEDTQSESIDRTKAGRFRWPEVRHGISILWPNLAFIAYMVALYLGGSFIDWQELVIEPWLMLRGLKSYSDIATQHPPLLTEFLALIYRVFGTDISVRIVMLMMASAVVGFLTFWTVYKLAGQRAAWFSLLLLATFWPFYGGTNFWFDTFLPIFYLVSCLLVINGKSPRSFLFAGISLGMAFLLKQSSGLVALVMGIMVLAIQDAFSNRLKRFLALSVGISIPILIWGLWYFFSGQLADAFYWIIQYNLSGIYVQLAKARPPRREIIRLFIAIIPIIIVLMKAAFSKAFRKRIPWHYLFLLIIGFFAAFTIFPRWERWHVAPSVPFLVISLVLSGKLLLTRPDQSSERPPGKLIKAMLAAWLIVVFFDVGMFYPPLLIDRAIPHFAQRWPFHSYAPPPWVDEHFIRYRRDLRALAQFVREMTTENDRIFVWGWGGERIYRASDRLPAGKFYYTLPWFTRLPRFKEDLMTAFERGQPRLVVELKRQYQGVPTLGKFGVDLEEKGYHRLKDLEERFPEVLIWESGHSRQPANSDEKHHF